MQNLKVGSKVLVRQWSGKIVEGIVEYVLEDVKNGRPGIDYIVPSETHEFERNKWCYMEQIVQVL